MRRRKARLRLLKNFPATLASIARDHGCDPGAIEVWFADKARIGQKNGITRRWARRGTRPSAPRDQRYASTYIFGAVLLEANDEWQMQHRYMGVEAMGELLNPPPTNETLQLSPKAA